MGAIDTGIGNGTVRRMAPVLLWLRLPGRFSVEGDLGGPVPTGQAQRFRKVPATPPTAVPGRSCSTLGCSSASTHRTTELTVREPLSRDRCNDVGASFDIPLVGGPEVGPEVAL